MESLLKDDPKLLEQLKSLPYLFDEDQSTQMPISFIPPAFRKGPSAMILRVFKTPVVCFGEFLNKYEKCKEKVPYIRHMQEAYLKRLQLYDIDRVQEFWQKITIPQLHERYINNIELLITDFKWHYTYEPLKDGNTMKWLIPHSSDDVHDVPLRIFFSSIGILPKERKKKHQREIFYGIHSDLAGVVKNVFYYSMTPLKDGLEVYIPTGGFSAEDSLSFYITRVNQLKFEPIAPADLADHLFIGPDKCSANIEIKPVTISDDIIRKATMIIVKIPFSGQTVWAQYFDKKEVKPTIHLSIPIMYRVGLTWDEDIKAYTFIIPHEITNELYLSLESLDEKFIQGPFLVNFVEHIKPE